MTHSFGINHLLYNFNRAVTCLYIYDFMKFHYDIVRCLEVSLRHREVSLRRLEVSL